MLFKEKETQEIIAKFNKNLGEKDASMKNLVLNIQSLEDQIRSQHEVIQNLQNAHENLKSDLQTKTRQV